MLKLQRFFNWLNVWDYRTEPPQFLLIESPTTAGVWHVVSGGEYHGAGTLRECSAVVHRLGYTHRSRIKFVPRRDLREVA